MKAYYYKIHYAYRLNELDYESRTFESKRFFFRQNCEDELQLVLPRYIRLFKKVCRILRYSKKKHRKR